MLVRPAVAAIQVRGIVVLVAEHAPAPRRISACGERVFVGVELTVRGIALQYH
jgi:hypothetical protein